MPSLVIIGSQWGDEGKGKIVDLISQESDVVARYQGGSNAGHTVVDGDKQYILHLIPSGILHERCQCLIGNGVVVDPEALVKEIEGLEALGIDARSRLHIADCAHMVLPYHRLLDTAQEKLRGKGKIGTTGRGIGCAYGDKAHRCGVRLGDLRCRQMLTKRLEGLAAFYEPLFTKIHSVEVPDIDAIINRLMELAEILAPLLVDGPAWLHEKVKGNQRILIEGAQGILLDIDHGTYPYVTSSNPTPGGACTGLGLSPKEITRIAGVAKAYTTRVGEGPMPTEFEPDFAEVVRKEGGEYGATTGRPRRCGWFDAPAVRRSILISGIDDILLTKLDVLSNLETIDVATAYRINGQETSIFPSQLETDTEVEVVYETLPGWQTPIEHCKNYDDLPENARRYVERLEALLERPIPVVSVSADRAGTILRKPDLYEA